MSITLIRLSCERASLPGSHGNLFVTSRGGEEEVMQVLILTTRTSSASVLEKQLGRSPRTIQASRRQTKYSSGIMAGNYSFISPEQTGNLAVCFSCTDLFGSSRALRHSFSVCLHSSSPIAPLSHTLSLFHPYTSAALLPPYPFPLSLLSSAFFYPLFCFFSSQHILALHHFFHQA